jgi:hypothetical protein
MPDQQQPMAPGGVNTFSKGMVKDHNETFLGEGIYTHARNAVNNSHDGQIGVIGNEPSNFKCVQLPYTLIGSVYVSESKWVVFTTDDINSEIGIFDENLCGSELAYQKLVNSSCLNFKRTNPITAIYRKRYDCERIIYWDDGLNPTRSVDIDRLDYTSSLPNLPFEYTETNVNGCILKKYTSTLDCEKIRIVPRIQHPCLILTKGVSAGSLPNGSYQVCIAYTVNQVRVTDLIGLSEVQSVFTHENTSSSLKLTISNMDSSFDEFEVVLIAAFNQQTVAKSIGFYSTSQGTILIDRLDNEFVNVPLSEVVLRTEPVEKSDAIYTLNNYVLRLGVYSKYKFNYQLQANDIKANWVVVKYPFDYYSKGGNNTGYMRDEQYSFFIRWVYNTGEFSESYHIPGRKGSIDELSDSSSLDAFESLEGVIIKKWQIENTAVITSSTQSTLSDGGVVIAKGLMGYWESTEKYPGDRPDIWGPLCGQAIRHHKMPDVSISDMLNHFSDDGGSINILGVQFDNIAHPLDQNGDIISSIVGYEILRGSREGNKTIVAKGLLNNMREYPIPGNISNKGLMQNYPYNDLRADSYLTTEEQDGYNGSATPSSSKMSGYRQDIFSFHSPEVSFSNPYLSLSEVKVYQQLNGISTGSFTTPYKHPKFKVLTDADSVIGSIVGVISAATIFSKGIEIGATADNPIGMKIGPLPPFPTASSILPTVSSTGAPLVPSLATLASDAAYVGNLVTWGIEAAQAIIFIATFAELQKEKFLSLMMMLIPKGQFAAQYTSHGFYNKSVTNKAGNIRRKVIDVSYVGNGVQQFGVGHQINNLNRSKVVVVKTSKTLPNPTLQDNSRYTMGDINTELNVNNTTNISSYYGALKTSLPSQYGQLESIKQLPISTCIQASNPKKNQVVSSDVMFGGDIYINRFTEKNTMFFFNSWLMGEPDEIEYDYTLYTNVPYPRFWLNSIEQKRSLLMTSSKYRVLDKRESEITYVRKGYFYLFNSGVRDFFVESEINLGYRDWDDDIAKRHYDPARYTDLVSLFRSDVIRSGNFYKYDYSLSISKLFNSSISWGNMLPRDYNPTTASTCYVYRPNRVIYSLPQNDQSKQDAWRLFLANNFKDFRSRVTSIKAINKTGALFMMKYASPVMFIGTEELKLNGTNTAVTIGNGALFANNQNLQSTANAEDSYEYGSNQSRFSSINTTHGVFWVSQNQGKIFVYAPHKGENMVDITANGMMKYWFAKYLPSQLLKVYPGYIQDDNTIIGVGVQMSYDATNEIIYVSKKDYKPLTDKLTYDVNGNFYNNGQKVELTDTTYFEEASWTASFDPKSKMWISFHDWIPTLTLAGRLHLMSVNSDSIWMHNVRCDSYCNFYGIDYPFDIEFVSSTGQQVNSVRNIEYLLEVYKMHNDCKDKFHVLDTNFDYAIVYNSEQISGTLHLNLMDRNNPLTILGYPKIYSDHIDINFSKVEQKYRFNQFWDITKDRGERNSSIDVPMFNTSANGYEYPINPEYVNYDKVSLERKKFRHTINKVFLRKSLSGNQKLLFKISNVKNLNSPR